MQSLLSQNPENLTTAQLVYIIAFLNSNYRQGTPVVNDDEFDNLYLAELEKRNPQHPYLQTVQPEQESVIVTIGAKGRIAHSTPMLSTQKGYNTHDIEKWVKRCFQAAKERGIDPNSLKFRATPKLDGIACRIQRTGSTFLAVTRGDSRFGNDISHLFNAGVQIIGDTSRQSAVGELVMSNNYFEQKGLAQHFAHPRNFIAGIASADNLNKHAQAALEEGGVHFVIYDDLKAPNYSGEQLIQGLSEIEQNTLSNNEYPTDGVVIQVDNAQLFKYMGHTTHHWNAQIAKKSEGATAIVKVIGVTWQVGRTGRVSPVVNIEPTQLSGCEISNVTAHHAGYLKNNGIGRGAELVITRSGEVIPTISRVKVSATPEIPQICPCCSSQLECKNDFLICPNADTCTAQAATALQYFAKTVKMDLIGLKTSDRLANNGITSIPALLTVQEDALIAMGFGAGQAKNIRNEIDRLKAEPLADNLLLASIGIPHAWTRFIRKAISKTQNRDCC